MTSEAEESKYPRYYETLRHLKQMIREQNQNERQRILEIARMFEGTMPKEKIASRIVHDFKKALKEEIESLQGELSYLEEKRYNMKRFVYKVLPDEYKENRTVSE
jgi:tRNA A37 N6-isopentenylltransferase MiaA